MSLCTTVRRAQLLSYSWTPMVEQLRFSNRPNLKRPGPPHLRRARMLRVCEPEYAPPVPLCLKNLETDVVSIEDNAYGVFLARAMRQWFYEHPMTAIFHTNSYTGHDLLRIRGLCFDNGFDMMYRGYQSAAVAALALKGTKFEPALRIMVSPFGIMYCKSPDIRQLLRLTKKMPQWLLIGVVLDGRLMHKADFEAHAATDLESVRAQFSNTLNLIGGVQLSQNLLANVQSLTHSLSTHVSESDVKRNCIETLVTQPEDS